MVSGPGGCGRRSPEGPPPTYTASGSLFLDLVSLPPGFPASPDRRELTALWSLSSESSQTRVTPLLGHNSGAFHTPERAPVCLRLPSSPGVSV